jgi:hypothetical protein
MFDGENEWLIFERGHVAATAWAIFAGRGYNPFWDSVVTWTNPWNAADVNNSGTVEPEDVLIAVNYLNSHGAGRPPAPPQAPAPYLDVSGDGLVAPVDALLVINVMNLQATEAVRGAEGEGSAKRTAGLDAWAFAPTPHAVVAAARITDFNAAGSGRQTGTVWMDGPARAMSEQGATTNAIPSARPSIDRGSLPGTFRRESPLGASALEAILSDIGADITGVWQAGG